MPLFSIITICYNAGKSIDKTMKSVYTQTFQDYEHIIQDGRSADKTLEIVESREQYYLGNQLRIFSESDAGIYNAMNKALEKVKGQFVCFMNAGDEFENVHVLEAVSEVIRRKEADMYYGTAAQVYPNGVIRNQFLYHAEKEKDLISALVNGVFMMPCHQAIFANKKCFADNMFEEKYKLRAEFNWFVNCIFKQMTVCDTNLLICKYLRGGFSDKTGNREIAEREIRDIFEIHKIDRRIDKREGSGGAKAAVEFKLIDNWLALRSAGKTVAPALVKRQIRSAAIYGCGILGNHLYNELKDTTIEISYFIDNQVKNSGLGVDVFCFQDDWPVVDIIIVTPVIYYDIIEDEISNKVKHPIISLEELLNESWY